MYEKFSKLLESLPTTITAAGAASARSVGRQAGIADDDDDDRRSPSRSVEQQFVSQSAACDFKGSQ